LKISYAARLLALCVLCTSCAWLDSMERSLIGEEEPRKQSGRRQTVPKAQYDQLLSQVEELKRENQALKEGRPSSNPLVGELEQTPVITNSGVQGQTVDVFTDAAPAADAPLGGIENQLMDYRRAIGMQEQNPGEAMKAFAVLARGATATIKVRAQLHMGEILMKQGEWDLALQAFDEIITRQAHSGVVLAALKNLVVCADKLGLAQKRDQYQSLLRDVFQAGT
jgi:hypothetical protein